MIQIKDFDMPRLGRCSTGTLTVWRRPRLDCRDEFGRKMCGQTLNDVQELQDFLLPQGINLVVQQFYFKFRLHIYAVVVLCVRIGGSASS